MGESERIRKRACMLDGPVRWLILADYDEQNTQKLSDAAALYAGDASDSASAQLGHVYLARVVDEQEIVVGEQEILVKLIVVAHTPGQSVTLRWERLP